MKHLFSCLKTYRKEAVLAPLFKFLEACMELLVPLVVAHIVNTGVGNGDQYYILYGCLLLVAFGAAGLAFALTAQYFAAKAAVGVSAELRARLFTKLQSYSYAQIDEVGTAAMITRMTSDCQQVQNGVNMFLRILLRSPIIVFGAAAMAFTVDVKSAFVILALIPLLAVVVVAVMAAGIPLYRKVQAKLDGVNLSARENLQGVRVIRAFCREEEEGKEFRARSGALCREQRRAGAVSALANPLTYALVNIAVIVLLYVSGLRVHAGSLEQGDVLALYSYLSIILVELVKLANLIFTVSKAVSSQKRIGKILDEEGEPATLPARGEMKGALEAEKGNSAPEAEREICGSEAEKENSAPERGQDVPALRFENVAFTYRGGGAPALDGIDFSVAKGTTVGILGGTGSGKTTLVNLIPRFYAASGGRVLLDGEDVNSIPADRLRTRVAVVPQHAVLFKGTIRSNLLWGGEGTDEELMRAAEIAQAADVVEAKGGLDGEVAQDGKNFSGGQRQRLTIARALVRKPEVLILDDSASALDYATDAALRRALKTLPCTVVVVSQRVAAVRHAEQIVLLDEGRIAAVGSHEELLKTSALYGEIYASQTRAEGERA